MMSAATKKSVNVVEPAIRNKDRNPGMGLRTRPMAKTPGGTWALGDEDFRRMNARRMHAEGVVSTRVYSEAMYERSQNDRFPCRTIM